MRLPSCCGSVGPEGGGTRECGRQRRKQLRLRPVQPAQRPKPILAPGGAPMITASDPRRLYPATAAAERLPSPAALDEVHVAAYHRDGFLAIENLLTAEEVATAKAALDDLLHGRVPGFDGLQPEPEMKARWDAMSRDERVAADRAVLVPLPPGGALFFTSLLHHGTPPNESPHRRWAVQFHYVGESVVAIDRLQHAALYFEDDRYAGCRPGTGRPIKELTG